MKNIKIGGVPEHFNLPWLDAIDQFDDAGIRIHWLAQPQGTGAMVEALEQGDLDVAVMLTEGAVAAIAGGAAFDVAGTWVESPLQWGIHVPGRSAIDDEAAIRGRRYAISRHGSGSHLMSCAHARAHGWPLEQIEFVVVGTLDGAVAAFRDDRADVFFWERYMTAPLVDAGTFRRVGIFTAPWPAFVVCPARRLDDEQRSAIARLCRDALDCARAFSRDQEKSAARINEVFGIETQAALHWLAQTRWADTIEFDERMLLDVARELREAGLIEAMPVFRSGALPAVP